MTYPGAAAAFQEVDGCRFYRHAVCQPWRDKEDVIEGFDWSLPPGTRPAPGSWVKGAPAGDYPGNRIESYNTTWRAIEPEEGRFDFSGIELAADRARQAGSVLELHVRASVWDYEARNAAGEVIPKADPGSGELSAPRWLKDVIPAPELTETHKAAAPGSRSLINCNIFQPEYNRRYLRMVKALAQSGIPDRPEIAVVFIHMVSSSAGEENDGASVDDPMRGPIVRDRIKAWVDGFSRPGRQFAFTGALPENLAYCDRLGVGQRNGLVECYLLHTCNTALGQSMDDEGHMHVNESIPPIARGLFFGDENEEYAASGTLHVERFGPRTTWNHRYREATLRVLQMRRNYVWEPYGVTIDPFLSGYLALELGQGVADSPDAWCYLRESYVHAGNIASNPAVPVRNFERWLVQRDLPGAPTEPVRKVVVKDYRGGAGIYNCYVPGMNYDYVARSGRRFGFALDDRFIIAAQQAVAFKITYYDGQPWELVYRARTGMQRRAVPSQGDGTLRTATIFAMDAAFDAQGETPDFEIVASSSAPVVLRFVRVVRIPATRRQSP